MLLGKERLNQLTGDGGLHEVKLQAVKMASLMESYEQQYSNLTAEITAKIGKIPNLHGSRLKYL